ncbi:MAG: recombinase, partial [Bacillota bacterium]|nr:recombinase [Bacillota bacterium]
MSGEKNIKLHNKSDKPDNIVLKEHEIVSQCEEIQDQLPRFLRGFFAYLRGNVLPMSRLSYLHDIKFFCQYLVDETDLTEAEKVSDIKLEDFNRIKA